MTFISQEYLPVIYLSSMIYYMALAHMIKEAEESQDLLLARQRHRKANIQTVVTVWVHSLRTRRADDGVCPSSKASRWESQEEPML